MMATKPIKEGKDRRKERTPPFHITEPWEENLLMEEPFDAVETQYSAEREQGITKVLSFEERDIASEIFPSLLKSASSRCSSWDDSEDPDDSSIHDDSSPSALSVSIGYFPSHQTCEDFSGSPVQPMSINNENRKTDNDYSGRDNQNKDRPDQSNIIKQDNKSTVSKSGLDMHIKDINPSNLTMTEENFQREHLEDILEPQIQEMRFNIQQNIWRKTGQAHQKSSKERSQRSKIEPEKRHQGKQKSQDETDDFSKPPKDLGSQSPTVTQSAASGDSPAFASRLSFHRLFQWVRKTFSRAKVNPLNKNKPKDEEAQREPRSRASRLWRWLLWKQW